MSMHASGAARGEYAIDATGWISGVRIVNSPNCDERPRNEAPSLIVVHGISLPPGEFGGGWIDALFTNALPADRHAYFSEIADLRVSAHALISRHGQLTQYVSFSHRAWHAGESMWCGRCACNDFSVGIELEGVDELPYADAQYESLSALIRGLRNRFPSLRNAEIVGHSDIAPGRKTDPGPAFDWGRLRAMLS